MFFLYNNFFSWLKCDSELKAWWINEKDVFSLLPPSNRRVWRTFQDMKINYWKIIFLILLYFNINSFGAHTHTNVSMCISGTDRTNVVGWRKDVVLFNPKLAPACLLKSLIMWMNLTPRSWTFTLTQGVTPVILKDWRLSLITRQPPVIHRVSASQSLGSTVIWARAITTSPTDVTWERLKSPNLLSNKAWLSRRSAAQEFPRSHENGKA